MNLDESIWILEKQTDSGYTLYYAGDGKPTTLISLAFSFGAEGIANEFLKRTKNDLRIAYFADFIPTEYRLERAKK